MFKRHPLSAAFPDITGEEFEKLKTDLLMNGQINPIILFENMILDGWNRYRALGELNKAPLYGILPKNADSLKYVVSANLHRRHLTVAQRVELATKLLGEEEKRAAIRQKELGRTHGKTPLASRDAKGKAAEKVAKAVGVSARSVERSKTIKKKAVKVVKAAVASGAIGLKEGARIAGLPKQQQRRAIRQPTSTGLTHAEIEAKTSRREHKVTVEEALETLLLNLDGRLESFQQHFGHKAIDRALAINALARAIKCRKRFAKFMNYLKGYAR